jgi:hypothetical protein
MGFDELKTDMLERNVPMRSQTPQGVRQELWGVLLAYNLVRREMEQVAKEANVSPLRISFIASYRFIRDEFLWDLPELWRLGTSRDVALRRTVKPEHAAGATLADPKLPNDPVHRTLARAGSHHSFALTAFNMSMSSAWSATSFLRRRFSSSSRLRRVASATSIPPYLRRHA